MKDDTWTEYQRSRLRISLTVLCRKFSSACRLMHCHVLCRIECNVDSKGIRALENTLLALTIHIISVNCSKTVQQLSSRTTTRVQLEGCLNLRPKLTGP